MHSLLNSPLNLRFGLRALLTCLAFFLANAAFADKPITLPKDNWSITANISELQAGEAVWFELQGADLNQLFRLGVMNQRAYLQQWKDNNWSNLWTEPLTKHTGKYRLAIYKINDFIFFEAEKPGSAQKVLQLNASNTPTTLTKVTRLNSGSKTQLQDVVFHQGMRKPIVDSGKSEPVTMGDEVITCFIPWFPVDYTALGYQRQYDFPVIPLLPDSGYNPRTEQYKIMQQNGITVVSADLVFFNADRVRAASRIYERMLDALPLEGEGAIKIVPMLELKEIPAAIAGIAYLLESHGDDPRWLKVDGRPFILTYHNGAHIDMTPAIWQSLAEGVKELGFDPFIVYNFEGIQVALTGTVDLEEAAQIIPYTDGVYHFGGSSLKEGAKFPAFIREHFQDLHPEMIVGGAVHVGYYSNRTYNRNVISHRHTGELRENFEFLLSGNPDFIHLTTWNDYNEATTFCPSYSDIGARLEIVKRMVAEYFEQPQPVGKAGVPEIVLSYRKEIYPGEPLMLEVLPLVTQKGPKQGKLSITVETYDGEVILQDTSPTLDLTKLEPWYTTEVDLPPSLNEVAPMTLRVTAKFTGTNGESIEYANMPDILISEWINYGDQLYCSIPLHHLSPPDRGIEKIGRAHV